MGAQPDMRERLEALDFYPVESTPDEFAARIKVELEASVVAWFNDA
jgi:hypothetical protein